MKLGTRIFWCYLLIFALCFAYPIIWSIRTLRLRYLEGIEDPLTDQANLLAVMIGHDMETQHFNPDAWRHIFDTAYARQLNADIYTLHKTGIDIRVYITNRQGRVIFDSQQPDNEGADYAAWRDVRLTLQGEYGTRTTRSDPDDPTSSVFYVAAPILVHGELAGVLSVAKPMTNINTFLHNAKPQIIQVGLLSAGAAILLSFLVSVWLTRPIRRLIHYADSIRQGKRPDFPRLDRSEIGSLGQALEKMQVALEGKKYVERYVQNLTHEIKSPLSAIQGAAELLQEPMPPERQTRFLTNIHHEANRIQKIVDRLLELAALETRTHLDRREKIAVTPFIMAALESKHAVFEQKRLRVELDLQEGLVLWGDAFLLHQAMSNLLQNAVDFSPPQGCITLRAGRDTDVLQLVVEDQGHGIPDYALERVFDKFFSLHRPGSGNKSTGLGLNFVREVAILHGGSITLENLPKSGARATLYLPA